MGDILVQTEPPANVMKLPPDQFIGERICKNFGSRTFWGSLVSCYWISGGLFYKVSFDDGDVDLFSLEEIVHDLTAAQYNSTKENIHVGAKESRGSSHDPMESPREKEYFKTMRAENCKKRRDDEEVTNAVATTVCIRRVQLWGQRLYASIYTNMQNETCIQELLKTDDGKMGEMEATGQVQVGDVILAVNQTRVLGMTSKKLVYLIQQQKRPIMFTLYRPPRPEILKQLQRTPIEQDQTMPVASSEPTMMPQIPQHSKQMKSVPLTQHSATSPRQQTTVSASSLLPSSLDGPLLTYTQPSSMLRNVADEWIQQSSISQTRNLLTKERKRQRLSKKVAVTQVSNMPDSSATVFNDVDVASVSGVSSVPSSMCQPHQTQIMQNVANAAAASKLSSEFAAPAAPCARSIQPASSIQYEHNRNSNQHQPTGPLTIDQRPMQQMKVMSGYSRETRRDSALTATSTGAKRSFVVSHVEPERRITSSQPEKTQQENSTTSQHTKNQELTSDQDTAVSAPHQSRISTSTLGSPAPRIDTSTLTTHDAEAAASLAETNSRVAECAMNSSVTSSLSQKHAAIEDMKDTTLSTSAPAAIVHAAKKDKTAHGTSNTTSFLSPINFNIQSDMLSRRHLPKETIANNNFAEPVSNNSVATVNVFRHRLCLTLGVQGTFVAVSSFIRDDFGQPGEVEASGKVFIGDVLVRINDTLISAAGLMPSQVADMVNRLPRPMTLWFERASWEILDGKR